ncbi:LCP family protein [Actinocorallia libanotica]|uniref:LCP family protein n=1 Tax=Actinocorallia libanotica TaxID=46162 RepID=A0ABN1Q9P0_9ACTN
MDDLKMLRDLGRDLEHEPPASLAHQRDRMYGRRPARLTRPKSWLVLGVAAAVTASALLAPRLLLDSETGHQNVLKAPAAEPKPTKDVNLLLLGSDQRAGRNAKKESARSDTIIVAHVPVSGSGVKMISIPRDTLVDVPDCVDRSGRKVPGRRTAINQAFSTGGAECSRRTVENLTGITLDHTIVFGFQTFKKLVDAIGGVKLALANEVVIDPETGKTLPQGTSTLNGEEALGYVRARHGLGDGSDLERIKRQQKLMAALLEKAEPYLDDPAQLAKLANGIVPALDADPAPSLSMTVEIFRTFARSDDRTVAFSTAPWEPAPEDPNRLVLKQPDAENLWRTLR